MYLSRTLQLWPVRCRGVRLHNWLRQRRHPEHCPSFAFSCPLPGRMQALDAPSSCPPHLAAEKRGASATREDQSKRATMEQVRASHLLVKHRDSRRPSSWKACGTHNTKHTHTHTHTHTHMHTHTHVSAFEANRQCLFAYLHTLAIHVAAVIEYACVTHNAVKAERRGAKYTPRARRSSRTLNLHGRYQHTHS